MERRAYGTKLRTEFNTLSKDFRAVRDSYSRVLASVETPSAAGDLALIFNYMKMLDPGSVVRESEFANAAASGSLGQRWIAAGRKLLAGERLSAEMRADFLDRSHKLYKSQKGIQQRHIKRYSGLAQRAGIKSEDVVAEVQMEVREGQDAVDRIINEGKNRITPIKFTFSLDALNRALKALAPEEKPKFEAAWKRASKAGATQEEFLAEYNKRFRK